MGKSTIVKRIIKSKTGNVEETNKIIKIKKNSFGENAPEKDIYLSGHHRIIFFTEDNTLLGVQALKIKEVADNTVSRHEILKITEEDDVYYYNIELETSDAGLIASGLPIESYREY